MTIDDQIINEKLQHDFNKEAAKIFALSSGKHHKYEYLTGEDILPSNQQKIIEQRKFTYSPLGKALEKEAKTIEKQGEKQVDVIKSYGKIMIDEVIPKTAFFSDEAVEELNKIKEFEKNVDRGKLTYKSGKNTNSFK